MSEKEPEIPQSAEDKKESQLDIYSREFDPVAALYSTDFVIPSPAAPIFDTVESYVRKGHYYLNRIP